jgi:hypothetical protein
MGHNVKHMSWSCYVVETPLREGFWLRPRRSLAFIVATLSTVNG